MRMVRYLAECLDCGATEPHPNEGHVKTWARLHERFHDHHVEIDEVEDDLALVA